MSCASSAAIWALSLLSQSQHNTYDVVPISYGSAAARRSSRRDASVTSRAPPRVAPRGPLPVPAPHAHPRVPLRSLSPAAPTPLLAAVPVRGSRAVIAVRSLLAARSLYRRCKAAYSHSRTLLWWNSFISASFVRRKSSQWLCCNARASFSFQSAANASMVVSFARREVSLRFLRARLFGKSVWVTQHKNMTGRNSPYSPASNSPFRFFALRRRFDCYV